jgi:hypothetical protein
MKKAVTYGLLTRSKCYAYVLIKDISDSVSPGVLQRADWEVGAPVGRGSRAA